MLSSLLLFRTHRDLSRDRSLFSAVYLSYLAEGKGGLIVGILGVAAFVLAIVSVGLSIWGLLKKSKIMQAAWSEESAAS